MQYESFSMIKHFLGLSSMALLLGEPAACGSSPSVVPSLAEAPTAAPTVSETQVPSFPTATAGSTNTPGLSSNPTDVPADCYRARFVADVTIPDDWETGPGTAFTKTRTPMNAGTCAWIPVFTLVFDHGDRMDASAIQALPPGTVALGAMVDFSVNLKAPDQPTRRRQPGRPTAPLQPLPRDLQQRTPSRSPRHANTG
jgi:hypothetical protein